MKKKLLSILLAFTVIFSFTACENQKPKTDEERVNEQKEKTGVEEDDEIDGFQNATRKYDKFNSYARDNGLADTWIYIEGKVLNQTKHEKESEDAAPVLSIIVEQEDGNRWCVSVSSEEKLEDIKDKEVRIFGIYTGFSDVFNVPAMVVGLSSDEAKSDLTVFSKAKIEVKSGSDYKEVWNFYDDYLKPNLEANEEEEKTEETTSSQTEQSTVPTATMGQTNALERAKDYLRTMAFSYSGLVEQLEYEGFSHDEAVYGVDHCGADWNAQAVIKAKNYLDLMAFSRDGLIEQLEYEGFTAEQAAYGAQANGY